MTGVGVSIGSYGLCLKQDHQAQCQCHSHCVKAHGHCGNSTSPPPPHPIPPFLFFLFFTTGHDSKRTGAATATVPVTGHWSVVRTVLELAQD